MSIKTLCPLYICKYPRESLCDDPNYAWQVLEYEIAIELAQTAKGDDIAKLLSLYMAGVEMTNSVLDPRESYFRRKSTELMSKQNVIRGLNKLSNKNKQQERKLSPVKEKLLPKLIEKKKNIQMRLAYETEDNNRQILNQLIKQQVSKQTNITKAIQAIINSHNQILNERIEKRKLKATTSPSQSEINQIGNKQVIKESNPTHILDVNKQPNNIRRGRSNCSEIPTQQFTISPRSKRRNSSSLHFQIKVQLQ